MGCRAEGGGSDSWRRREGGRAARVGAGSEGQVRRGPRGGETGQDAEGMDDVLVAESVSASLCGPDKRLLSL